MRKIGGICVRSKATARLLETISCAFKMTSDFPNFQNLDLGSDFLLLHKITVAINEEESKITSNPVSLELSYLSASALQ